MADLAQPTESRPPDAILGAISDSRRRIVLRTLTQTDAPSLDIDRLVDHIVDAEPHPDDPAFHTRVGVTLRHIHLPKLVAAGLIEYKPTANRVRLIDDSLRADLLAVIDAHETA